jgi:hypothetical protein
MSFTHLYSVIKTPNHHLPLVVSSPAIKSKEIGMKDCLPDIRSYLDVKYLGEGDKSPWQDLPCAGIIRHLKEEFGDYNDPTTYKWNDLEIIE